MSTVYASHAASAATGLTHEALIAASAWLSDNAASNDFAASLMAYMARHGGLTAPQWLAAHKAATGQGKFKRRPKTDNAARQAAPKATRQAAQEPAAKPSAVAVQGGIKNNRAPLSPVDRATARKAIASADGWKAYAAQRGINTASLSGNSLYDAADTLGVDVAATIRAANDDTRAAAADVFSGIGQGNASPVGAAFGAVDWQRVRRIAREEVEERLKPVIVTQTVIATPQGTVNPAASASCPVHPQFGNLCAAISVRDFAGHRLSVIAVGPTGTGKSYAARQAAQALGLPFCFQSIAVEPADLVGYVDLHREQKITPFVRAYRDGGVCLLDELDRYSPKALVALNAALANGAITLDNGEEVARHADFVCIGSANTTGFGASGDFTAAERLDLSTISRFAVRLDWHVDKETEEAICRVKATDSAAASLWLAEIRKARAALERLALPPVADQRAIEAGAQLLAAGLPIEQVRAMTYLALFDADQSAAISDIVNRS